MMEEVYPQQSKDSKYQKEEDDEFEEYSKKVKILTNSRSLIPKNKVNIMSTIRERESMGDSAQTDSDLGEEEFEIKIEDIPDDIGISLTNSPDPSLKIKKTTCKSILEANPGYGRKRSYSKEEVKMDMEETLELKEKSQSFALSDENEYEEKRNCDTQNDEEELDGGKNKAFYARSSTFPCTQTKSTFKGLRTKQRKDTYSPTKDTRYTSNTCYSSNLPSECEGGNNFLAKGSYNMKAGPDFNLKAVPFDLLSSKQIQTEEGSFSEKEKYEKVIQFLTEKVSDLKAEVNNSRRQAEFSNKLCDAYKTKYERATQQNLVLYSKFLKTAGCVKQISDNQEKVFEKQNEEIMHLRRENTNLRKLLSLSKETDAEEIEPKLRSEEAKVEVAPPKEAKPKSEFSDLYEDADNSNPFNKKKGFQMKKPSGMKITSKEMIKNEIKRNRRNMKRPRTSSFYISSATPNTNDDNFDGFDFSMGNDFKTPLPKNTQKSFSFKMSNTYEELEEKEDTRCSKD